jgi:hypothetical protein
VGCLPRGLPYGANPKGEAPEEERVAGGAGRAAAPSDHEHEHEDSQGGRTRSRAADMMASNTVDTSNLCARLQGWAGIEYGEIGAERSLGGRAYRHSTTKQRDTATSSRAMASCTAHLDQLGHHPISRRHARLWLEQDTPASLSWRGGKRSA